MELIRRVGYVDGESALIIMPKRPRSSGNNMLCIMEKDMWRLIDPQYMFQAALAVNDYFDLGLATPQKLAKIAMFLQDGIEDCVLQKPEQRESKTIGEGKLTIAGSLPIYFEVKDKILE